MTWRWLLVAIILLLPAAASAQYRPTSVPVTSLNPRDQPEETPKHTDLDSAVSFIDSALPRNTLRLRVDLASDANRPVRSEYLYAKDGFLLPERRVDSQSFESYVEYAVGPWFSVFASQPLIWTNPDVNANERGTGNIDLGLKFAFLDLDKFLTSFQFRATLPTASDRSLETRRWAIEPAFLMNFRPFQFLTFEGEVRYWMPLTDSPYAGDVARYGIGVGYGQRGSSEIWMIPVAELVGWTAMGGKVDVVEPGAIDIQNARGQSIFNAALGVRVGLGSNLEFYGGYTRAISGTTWSRDTIRVEFRWMY